MNKVILSGNLCKAVERTRTQTGRAIVHNTIAVRRDFKEKDGSYQTDFIQFTAFGKQAEYLSNYAHMGDRAELCGRWQTRTYQDKAGNTRTANEVAVENIKVFSQKKADEDFDGHFQTADASEIRQARKDEASNRFSQKAEKTETQGTVAPDDDLPF